MIANSSSISCGVSTAVGSSRISTLASLARRLDDLDALLHADGEVLDQRVGVDGEAVARRRARARGRRRPCGRAGPPRSARGRA